MISLFIGSPHYSTLISETFAELDHKFNGELFVVNPKKNFVQGVQSYQDINELPEVDLAIIAIAAKYITETVKILTQQKQTKGFIIFSAGFSEKNEKGALLINYSYYFP